MPRSHSCKMHWWLGCTTSHLQIRVPGDNCLYKHLPISGPVYTLFIWVIWTHWPSWHFPDPQMPLYGIHMTSTSIQNALHKCHALQLHHLIPHAQHLNHCTPACPQHLHPHQRRNVREGFCHHSTCDPCWTSPISGVILLAMSQYGLIFFNPLYYIHSLLLCHTADEILWNLPSAFIYL